MQAGTHVSLMRRLQTDDGWIFGGLVVFKLLERGRLELLVSAQAATPSGRPAVKQRQAANVLVSARH